MPNRGENLFQSASRIINGNRQDQYGNPENSFNLIAMRWSQIISAKTGISVVLSGKDVALMMTDLKIARELTQHHRDNIIDAVGYLGLLDDMRSNPED